MILLNNSLHRARRGLWFVVFMDSEFKDSVPLSLLISVSHNRFFLLLRSKMLRSSLTSLFFPNPSLCARKSCWLLQSICRTWPFLSTFSATPLVQATEISHLDCGKSIQVLWLLPLTLCSILSKTARMSLLKCNKPEDVFPILSTLLQFFYYTVSKKPAFLQ